MAIDNETNIKVQVVIYHSESEEFLILQTNKRRGEFWQNVTGSAESDESELEAAKRELSEETSLKCGKILPLDIQFEFEDQWKRSVLEKCFVAWVEGKEITLDPSEHQSFKWLKKEMISGETFKYSSNYECFLKALEQI